MVFALVALFFCCNDSTNDSTFASPTLDYVCDICESVDIYSFLSFFL